MKTFYRYNHKDYDRHVTSFQLIWNTYKRRLNKIMPVVFIHSNGSELFVIVIKSVFSLNKMGIKVVIFALLALQYVNAQGDGIYVADTAGAYKADTAGAYKVDTVGSYKSDGAGAYTADDIGSYKADGAGVYVADAAGQYKADTVGSYKPDNLGKYVPL